MVDPPSLNEVLSAVDFGDIPTEKDILAEQISMRLGWIIFLQKNVACIVSPVCSMFPATGGASWRIGEPKRKPLQLHLQEMRQMRDLSTRGKGVDVDVERARVGERARVVERARWRLGLQAQERREMTRHPSSQRQRQRGRRERLMLSQDML